MKYGPCDINPPVSADHAVGPRPGNGTTSETGATLRPAVRVTCASAGGTALRNVEVDWKVVTGGGSVGGGTTPDLVSTFTNDQGIAEVPWTLGATPGVQTLQGTVFDDGTPAAGIALAFSATATSIHACAQPGGTDQAPTKGERTSTSDETWTAAGSPHRGKAVHFLNGAVLTVEPGAVVCVGFLEFRFGARLVAEGTASSPILFSYQQGASFWPGLALQRRCSGRNRSGRA